MHLHIDCQNSVMNDNVECRALGFRSDKFFNLNLTDTVSPSCPIEYFPQYLIVVAEPN